jgi:putative DNA primase/helicase
MNRNDDDSLLAIPCSEIQEKPIQWLWRGYIPRGTLTLLEGPPKAGKSTVLTDLIARVTACLDMPDGSLPEMSGPVLLLSGEDSPEHVIVPRLRVAGASLNAVQIIRALDGNSRPRQFVIGAADVTRLEELIAETGAVLIVIDPLSIYLGNTDSHRESEVRQTLWHLSELAERTGCAAVGVRHWKKSRTGDALSQGGGSVGFGAAARSVLSVERDPDDKAARVLAVARSNYAQEYPSLGFRLESAPGSDVARVEWTGVCRHDADTLAGVQITGTERGALSEAMRFLDEVIPFGAAVPSREVFSGADSAGISRDTLKRAKTSGGFEAVKDGLTGGWLWRREHETSPSNSKGVTSRPFEGEHEASPSKNGFHGDAYEGDLQ